MSNLRVTSLRGRTAGSSPTLPDGVVVTGVTTSTSFSGNLTGNASGLTGTPNISCGTGAFSGNVTLQANLDLQDNDKILIGTGDDLEIYHDGSDSYIKDTGTGDLKIFTSNFDVRNAAGTENLIDAQENGAVKLFYDNSQKLITKSDGVDITGELQCDTLDVDGAADITGAVTLNGNLDLQDNDYLRIGTGDDLQLFHNAYDSYIDNTTNATGDLLIRNLVDDKDIKIVCDNGSGGSANYILCDGSTGEVKLYHYGTQKLETNTSGISVNGKINIDGAYEQVAETVGALNIDLSTGNYFKKSISTSSTVTFSNPPASGTVGSFTLELVLTGSSTAITWPAGTGGQGTVYWNGDAGTTAPTLVDARTHLFMFVTTDGGTKYRGAVLSDYTG